MGMEHTGDKPPTLSSPPLRVQWGVAGRARGRARGTRGTGEGAGPQGGGRARMQEPPAAPGCQPAGPGPHPGGVAGSGRADVCSCRARPSGWGGGRGGWWPSLGLRKSPGPSGCPAGTGWGGGGRPPSEAQRWQDAATRGRQRGGDTGRTRDLSEPVWSPGFRPLSAHPQAGPEPKSMGARLPTAAHRAVQMDFKGTPAVKTHAAAPSRLFTRPPLLLRGCGSTREHGALPPFEPPPPWGLHEGPQQRAMSTRGTAGALESGRRVTGTTPLPRELQRRVPSPPRPSPAGPRDCPRGGDGAVLPTAPDACSQAVPLRLPRGRSRSGAAPGPSPPPAGAHRRQEDGVPQTHLLSPRPEEEETRSLGSWLLRQAPASPALNASPPLSSELPAASAEAGARRPAASRPGRAGTEHTARP